MAITRHARAKILDRPLPSAHQLGKRLRVILHLHTPHRLLVGCHEKPGKGGNYRVAHALFTELNVSPVDLVRGKFNFFLNHVKRRDYTSTESKRPPTQFAAPAKGSRIDLIRRAE